MTDLSPARAAPPPPPPLKAIDPRVANAVALHRMHASTTLSWTESVQRLAPVVAIDHKAILANKRTLMNDPRAMMVMQLLWMESDFVDEGLLALMGAQSNFCGGLNCHALAIHLAEDKASVSKTEKALQKIMKAAAELGLIDVSVVGPKRHSLRATSRLDSIMLKLGNFSAKPSSAGRTA